MLLACPPSSPALRNSKSKQLAGVLGRKEAKEHTSPKPGRLSSSTTSLRDSLLEDSNHGKVLSRSSSCPTVDKSHGYGGRVAQASSDKEMEVLVQQIRSLCHDRKGIRNAMEQLDQRCRSEAVELRAQLSSAQASFAKTKLESDRLRRELSAVHLDPGHSAAVQEILFLETHVEGLRMGCSMVAEHLASLRAEAASHQSRVEQLAVEQQRASDEAGAALGKRSAAEAELRSVHDAMLRCFQETAELQQKFLTSDQEFAAVKRDKEGKAREVTDSLEEQLEALSQEESRTQRIHEEAKARLSTLRTEEAHTLAELQKKDQELSHLRELYESEREGSFLQEEQFMQNQRRSLQDRSYELQRSGGLISVETHERILREQTEFYGKALQALDDLERSCTMDRSQDCSLMSSCIGPEYSRDVTSSRKAGLQQDITTLACATATTEQDAELCEEQIRNLSLQLEAAAAQIAMLKEELVASRSFRDEMCRSQSASQTGADMLPSVIPEKAELQELQAALSSQHQRLAELEAEMIEGSVEEKRLQQKLPLLQSHAQESHAMVEVATKRLKDARCEVAEVAEDLARRRQELPKLRHALADLLQAQRAAVQSLRFQISESTPALPLLADLPQLLLNGTAHQVPEEWIQTQARRSKLKADIQESHAALRALTATLPCVEADSEAATAAASEVLAIFCAALPLELPDSVRGLLQEARAQVRAPELPRQIAAALAVEVEAALHAGLSAKEREAAKAAAEGFRSTGTPPRPSRSALATLQGRSATAAAQVADLSARLYTLGRDMCDAEATSSQEVLAAEAQLADFATRLEEAKAEQSVAAELVARLQQALMAQSAASEDAIRGAAEEAKESLQRSIVEASAETVALRELLPSEIARLEEACVERGRQKEAELKAQLSRCQSPLHQLLAELRRQRCDLDARQKDLAESAELEATEAASASEKVAESVASIRKEIKAVKEARCVSERAAERHADLLWDIEQTVTDVKERRTAELRREETELNSLLRCHAASMEELQSSIRSEEDERQHALREEAKVLAAELGPALEEVLKAHAELEAETLRLLKRGQDHLFAQGGA